MRFCLVSTHTDQTIGYSKISGNLLKHLAQKSNANNSNVQIFHFGFQRHAARANLKKVPHNVNSYDAAINEDPKEEGFGYNKFKEYLDMVRPDVVMIYNDILTISKFLDAMMTDPTQKTQELSSSSPNKYNVSLKPKFKLWLYLDVMYTGMHPVLLKKVFEITDRIYVFSETAKKHMKMYEDAMYGKLPEIRVQEHAVDEAVYFSPKETKFINRTLLGVPNDGIIFLNCNRNSGRKRLDTSVMAFARLLGRFRDLKEKEKEKDTNFKVPDVYFVFATGGVAGKPGNPSFYDIPRMYMEELKKLGFNLNDEIKKKLILIDTNVNIINDEGMNELYNLCDIGVNTSNGEGFGLCTFEHMVANGAAQIVTDVGCYSEYMKGPDSPLGLIVQKSGHGYFDVGQCAFGFEYPVFDVKDVADAFEKCVLNLDEWKSKARLVKKNLKTWEDATEGLWEDILKEC